VISVRGSGLLPTTAASAASGTSGAINAGFGLRGFLAFFGAAFLAVAFFFGAAFFAVAFFFGAAFFAVAFFAAFFFVGMKFSFTVGG
jgi:hypothetical protein